MIILIIDKKRLLIQEKHRVMIRQTWNMDEGIRSILRDTKSEDNTGYTR